MEKYAGLCSAGGSVGRGVQELETESLGIRVPVLPTHSFAAVNLLGLNLERDGLIRLGRDLGREKAWVSPKWRILHAPPYPRQLTIKYCQFLSGCSLCCSKLLMNLCLGLTASAMAG